LRRCIIISLDNDGFFDNAIYVTTKTIINNLVAEFISDKRGDVSAFFEFTKFKGSSVFVSPQVFIRLTTLLKDHEETFAQINSLIADGSFKIGKANFGSEPEDIAVLANNLLLTNPDKNVFIVKSQTENIISEIKMNENIIAINIEKIVEDIKIHEQDFRNLYWGN